MAGRGDRRHPQRLAEPLQLRRPHRPHGAAGRPGVGTAPVGPAQRGGDALVRRGLRAGLTGAGGGQQRCGLPPDGGDRRRGPAPSPSRSPGSSRSPTSTPTPGPCGSPSTWTPPTSRYSWPTARSRCRWTSRTPRCSPVPLRRRRRRRPAGGPASGGSPGAPPGPAAASGGGCPGDSRLLRGSGALPRGPAARGTARRVAPGRAGAVVTAAGPAGAGAPTRLGKGDDTRSSIMELILMAGRHRLAPGRAGAVVTRPRRGGCSHPVGKRG
ncbi:hypothetical protein SUDANB56_00010 [Streptomyces sp. enrichment culture]